MNVSGENADEYPGRNWKTRHDEGTKCSCEEWQATTQRGAGAKGREGGKNKGWRREANEKKGDVTHIDTVYQIVKPPRSIPSSYSLGSRNT